MATSAATVLTFQDLPEEVRGLILNLIGQRDTPTLRLVCKQWNQDVDKYYDYKLANLDETAPDFKDWLGRRVKYLGIHRLQTTAIMTPEGLSVFKYPNLISNLTIQAPPYSKYAAVSPANVQQLLGLLAKNLVILELQVSMELYRHEFPPNLAFDFPALKHLRVKLAEIDSKISPLTGLVKTLAASSFPKLTNFDGHLDIYPTEFGEAIISRMAGWLLKLVGSNGAFLQRLRLTCKYRGVSVDLSNILNGVDLVGLKALDKLRTFTTNVWPSGGATKTLWPDLLGRQTNLTRVSLNAFSKDDNGSGQVPGVIVPHNWATLTDLRLLCIKEPDPNLPLDLSILGPCQNLKSLVLAVHHTSIQDVIGQCGNLSFTNFHRLPPSLVRLEMDFVKILASEVLAAFTNTNDANFENTTSAVRPNTKGFQNLEVFKLHVFGEYARGQAQFVLTAEILDRILASGSLVEVLIRNFLPGKKTTVARRRFTAISAKYFGLLLSYRKFCEDQNLKVKRAKATDNWELITQDPLDFRFN